MRVRLPPPGPTACKPPAESDRDVDAEARGRGYGRSALEALESIARELGFNSIRLHVLGDNEIARSLYRSAGYVETDVTMRKPLG